jgi:hypothetical protein
MFLCGWKDGSMTDVVKNDPGYGLGKEAIGC